MLHCLVSQLCGGDVISNVGPLRTRVCLKWMQVFSSGGGFLLFIYVECVRESGNSSYFTICDELKKNTILFSKLIVCMSYS